MTRLEARDILEKYIADNLLMEAIRQGAEALGRKVIVSVAEWSWGIDFVIVMSDGSGSVRLSMLDDEGSYLITDLFVSRKCRRQGIATCLLDCCDKIIDKGTARVYVERGKDWIFRWYARRGYYVEWTN